MKLILTLAIPALFISFDRAKPYKAPKAQAYDIAFIDKNMAYIPTGTFTVGASDQDIPVAPVVKPRTVSVESFYMFNQEVCNGFYLQYANEIRKKDLAAYEKVLPDTTVWRERLAYNEPYVEYYFRHPAYANYPLVGIKYEQCLEFCNWLTEKYNSNAKRKFKKVVFDLPSEMEWEYAARGGLENSPFPWSGPYMQNSKGQYMANFKQLDQAGIHRMDFEVPTVQGTKVTQTYYVASGNGDYVGVAGRLNDQADITAYVKSYLPNNFKLWNMAGNVEEFVKEQGKTRGGSWRDPGYYLQNSVYEEYDVNKSASSERGFRFVMRIIEK